VLASASGLHSLQIAKTLGCASQTVRNTIKAFNEKGLAVLIPGSNRPKTVEPILNEADLQKLKALLHQSPRAFSKERSEWTLKLVAEVCFETGITSYELSDETIRLALRRLEVKWKRAKHWISSPDPDYARKKSDESD
jgi:transposase